MYGLFTYVSQVKWPPSTGNGLVNIPYVIWSIWENNHPCCLASWLPWLGFSEAWLDSGAESFDGSGRLRSRVKNHHLLGGVGGKWVKNAPWDWNRPVYLPTFGLSLW